MKLFVVFIILFIIHQIQLFSKPDYLWYFGINAGVRFTKTIVSTQSDCKVHTEEGTSVASDYDGNLIFYTDGVTVWNRNHLVMDNGSGLMGHYSSAQSSVILPVIGSNEQFYIFTNDFGNGSNGLRYNVADLSLNEGLGKVVSKNNLIYLNTSEKIDFIRHANNKDFWLVCHKDNSNQFLAFLINESGVSANPIISSCGFVINEGINFPGQIKLSFDGKFIAITSYTNGELLICKFDNVTGIVSDPLIINKPNQKYAYGIEFSQNSRYLYLSTRFGLSYLYQFDLLYYDSEKVSNSRTVIASSPEQHAFGALQLGPDGRIYHVEYNSMYLSAITNPENKGLGCNYISNFLYLNGGIAQVGLPSRLFPPMEIQQPQGCITVFDYPNFDESSKLIYSKNSFLDSSIAVITKSSDWKAGYVYYKETIDLSSGFETEFSFSIADGHNSYSDGSFTGADGLSLIIHGNDQYPSGLFASGLGYSGIPNSIAFEIDLYENDYQSDPNGNHFAVMSRKNQPNSHDHAAAQIAVNDSIIIIKDSTIYWCKIIFDVADRKLIAYLDKDRLYSNPSIEIDDFNLIDWVNPIGNIGYSIGLTASTGDSRQMHNLHSWRLCAYKPNAITSIPVNTDPIVQFMPYPNPIDAYVNIEFVSTLSGYHSVKAYNAFGSAVRDYGAHFITTGNNSINLDLNDFASGCYFIKIESLDGNANLYIKVAKN